MSYPWIAKSKVERERLIKERLARHSRDTPRHLGRSEWLGIGDAQSDRAARHEGW